MSWLRTELWTAEVVYTGFGTPMLRGALAVQGGFVVGQGSLEELRARFPEGEVVHKGLALLPPPVNAHTHLDLSLLPLYRGPFAGFLSHVVAHRERRGLEGAKRGLEELLASGVGAFADIVFKDEVMDFLLQESPLPGVAFYEVFAPEPSLAEEVYRAVRRKVEAWRRREGKVKVGLSPHAPYSVSPPPQAACGVGQGRGPPPHGPRGGKPRGGGLPPPGEGPLREVYGRFAKTPWTPRARPPSATSTPSGSWGPRPSSSTGSRWTRRRWGSSPRRGPRWSSAPGPTGTWRWGRPPSPSTPSTGWSSPWARTPGAQAPTWT